MINITSIICISIDIYDIDKIIEFRLKQYSLFHKEYVKYLFVLSGKKSKRIEDIIKSYNVDYVHSGSNNFNYSKLRNIAINYVETAYVIFEDIDLLHTCDFYKNLNNEISVLESSPLNFLSIPVAYLSKDYSEKIMDNVLDISFVKNNIDFMLNFESCENNEFLQHFIHMSSLIVTKLNTVFFVGGFDENFNSWGGEDRDFVFRLLAANTKIVLPKDFSYTSTENTYKQHKYVGWKSLWALHGDFMYNKGYLSFHLYHEPRNWRKLTTTKSNMNFASEKAKLIGKDYFECFNPLDKKKNLSVNYIYGRNPHILNLDLYNYMNGFRVLEEGWTIEKCKKILSQEQNVGSIIFWNPYGTKKRLDIYTEIKKMGYSTIVAERGALPRSIVFDKDNLCVYSNSYKREWWDKNISSDEFEETNTYIDKLIKGDNTLERNYQRLPESIINIKLHINKYSKKVLVCFQLDDDTVTNTDYCIKYKDFVEQIHLLSQNIPDGWLLMYKNHPLSNYKHELEKGICVDSYHIHDLLKVCDYVIVYNSGVGVIAQAFQKPVIIFGPAFYEDNYFNIKVKDYEELITIVNSTTKIIDKQKVIKFYSYLIHYMYSFCSSSDPIIRKRKSSNPIYYKRISYYSIYFQPYKRWKSTYKGIFNPEESILFKRFYSFFDLPLPKKKINNPPKSIPFSSKENIKKSKKNSLKKLKKLIRDPYKFFDDSTTVFRNLKYIFFK